MAFKYWLKFGKFSYFVCIEFVPASASCTVGENNLREIKPSEAQYVSRNDLGQNIFIF